MGNKRPTERQIVKQWLIDDGILPDEETLSQVFETTMRGIHKNPKCTLRYAYLRVVLEHYLELKE